MIITIKIIIITYMYLKFSSFHDKNQENNNNHDNNKNNNNRLKRKNNLRKIIGIKLFLLVWLD